MTGLSAGGARAKVLLSTVPRPLLGRDYCRPAICKPRLPSRRHSSGCAGRASRNRENCATEFSQHPFIRDHGRQLRLHGPRDSTVAVVYIYAWYTDGPIGTNKIWRGLTMPTEKAPRSPSALIRYGKWPSAFDATAMRPQWQLGMMIWLIGSKKPACAVQPV